jgi:hypothetical protein
MPVALVAPPRGLLSLSACLALVFGIGCASQGARTTTRPSAVLSTPNEYTGPVPGALVPPTLQPGDPDVPVLGLPQGGGSEGHGEVKPRTIYNGGSGTGTVQDLRWASWGDEQAIARGTGYYIPSHAKSAQEGYAAPVTVVTYELGRREGRLMYCAMDWYFPTKGERFHPEDGVRVCSVSP